MATDDQVGEAVFVDGEMLGSDPTPAQPDPNFTTSNELKEQAEEENKESDGEGVRNLKLGFIISGVAVALIGAIFAIAKKTKQAS